MIERFENDAGELEVDYPNLRELVRVAHELAVYITSNAGSLINYGQRYRAGERIRSMPVRFGGWRPARFSPSPFPYSSGSSSRPARSRRASFSS
jgi:hypothetical protein